MKFLSAIPVIGDLVDSISKGLDELFTSDEESGKIDIEKKRIELKRLATELKAQHAQLQINMVQANHPSLFVAGARPAIIWIGAVGLAYEAILRPLLNGIWTAFYKPDKQELINKVTEEFGKGATAEQIKVIIDSYAIIFPSIQTELFMPIVLGVLGIGGMRSWEKIQGKARNNMGAPAELAELQKILQEKHEQAKLEQKALEASSKSDNTMASTGNKSIDQYRQAAQDPNFKPKPVEIDDLLDDDHYDG